MATTSPRAEELLCDFVIRRGGSPWAYSVCHEWGLDGLGSTGTVELDRSLYSFAAPVLSARRVILPIAAMNLLATDGRFTACVVSNRREARDLIAAGFPVACLAGRLELLIGFDDLRLLATTGWIEGDEMFSTKLVAFSDAPAWNTRR
jgi:hypothetical protein